MQRTPSSNKSQQQQQLQRRNTSFEIMSRRKQGMMILCILIGTAYGFGGGGSGGSLFHHSLTAGVRTTSSTTTVDVIASLKGSSTKSVNLAGGRFTFGNLVGASTSSLQLSSSNSNENSSNESLELIQRWLLLHLPSLSDDDLQMYSMQLLEDGFDTVEKLEGVNNKMSRGSNNNNHRLEDLYFMKKGHRRVLLQKIGKIREMKGNVKNRLRLFEEEEEVGGDGKVNQQKDEVGGDEVKKVVVVVDENKMESGEKEPRGSEEKVQDSSTAATAGGLSMQSSSNNNNDDDSLISLTAWENKQLEEFVYSEQERDAMDDKSKRRLKEIEAYLKEHRREEGGDADEEEESGGGDEYDMTTFDTKQLVEFIYNEQTRGAMDDKSKRRLREIERYLSEKRQQREHGGEEEEEGGGDDEDEYDMTSFEQKELEEFVYNEQTRDVMDDKSKRRLKEIEAYIQDQQRQQQQRRQREAEELNRANNNDNDDEREAASLSSPSLPASWNFADLEDFMYTEQEREVMDDKGKRRLKEIEEYVRSVQKNRNSDGGNKYYDYDEEELLDDFAARYQGIVTARDGKKTSGGSVGTSSSVAKEEKRLQEFRDAWLARQRNSGESSYMDDEEFMDDFVSRYQKLGTATADGVSGGSSQKSARRLKELDDFLRARQSRQSRGLEDEEREAPLDDFEARYQTIGSSAADGVSSGGSSEKKSARRLKELDAFLRARQSRQSKGLFGEEEERETPLDDFEARYQTIGNSAADTVAGGRSDKSSRRLRALDAFLKSRQSRASAAAEEEALRLELLQKPIQDLTATERKERIRVEEFQRRARIAKEKEGKQLAEDSNVSKSSAAAAAAAARRKSNEERRLEELNKWTAKQNELVEKRRMAKMLAEYERLMKGTSKETKKKVVKPQVKEERSPPPRPLPNKGAAIDDFFEKRRIHSLSTTLPPSNVGRTMQQKSQNPFRSGDEEEFVGDKGFDISRSSFSERKSKSLSTTLPPSNENAKANTYVPGSKDKEVSDFLPTRSNYADDEDGVDLSRISFSERESRSLSTTLPPSNKNAIQNSYVPGSTTDGEDCVGDECVDITRNSFPERESRSLSTTLPPSNENAKQNTYVPGSKSGYDEDCVGDECVDITRSSFPERESRSLSTTLPPSNENAKANSYVPGSKSGDDEDCVGDECVDITRSTFPDRESKSLSTTLPPSNENAKANSYVPGSKSGDDEDCVGDECVDITRSSFPDRETKSLSTTLPPSNENAKTNSFTPESKKQPTPEEVEPEEYFDITTRLFQERPQSLSSGYQSVFKEEERSEMNSRAASLYARFQSKTSTPPTRSSIPSTRQVTTRSKAGDQSDMEGAYMDITQRLWDDRASSFKEGEKSEMNDRRRSPKPSPSVDDEKAGSYSSLSRFVNTDTKRSSDDGGDYVDESERFSDRSSFVQSVNSGTAKRGTTSGSYKDSTRSVSAPVSDYVDESERFSDRSSFVQSVNSGTNRKGMTSGSYKDRGATAPVSDESGDYVDESQRFSDRSSFVQSVNTGTAKRGTTSGSFVESKQRVRPGSSPDPDDGYQDITQNPFSRNRSSFVLRVNSGTRKMGTTAGSFRESKGRSEPEEKKYFSSDRSTLMGARTWRNEDVVTTNEHDKYLSSDRSSILGSPYIRDAGRSSDEHKKYMSSDRSSIVGAPSIRNPGGSSEEHKKYISSDRSSLSGAPSIRRKEVSNEYLDTNQFSSNLSPSSPVKASATNKLWRTTSEKAGEESIIDTPPAFMKNLDMLAGGRKTIKKRNASDEYLNKNSFSRNLAPSTMTQAATVASRNNNPYLNKNGFNAIDNMRTSNVSGAQFKRSHDVSPEEKKHLDNLDTRWAKLPDFDEMAGKSAVGENATGSRSPKLQEEEEYTVVGDFSRLERASSFVRDSNTAMKSNLSGLSEIGSNDQPVSGESSTTEESDSEFEVMNWLLKNLPQLDEEDAVNYFVSLLEDGFDSTEMLNEVLEEDLYFMKEEHQTLLMKNLAVEEDKVEEDKVEEAAAVKTKTTAFSESVDSMKKELEEASAWVAGKAEEAEDRRIAAELAEEEMDDDKEKEPSGKRRASTNEEDDEYTDITRANFGGERASLSSATPSLFEKDSPTGDGKKPFSWQLDVRKEVTKDDDEDGESSSDDIRPDSFSDLPAESKQLFQATPPVAVELKEGNAVKESASATEERRSGKSTKVDSKSRPLFQATPPLMVELKEGMTAEEAALAREERLSGEPRKVDQTPLSSQITEGMTAEEAEAARSTRLTATAASPDGPSVEAPKEIQKAKNIPPPRGELYQEYIARGFTTEQAQKLKDYYTTWTIGPSHDMKFTSVFTCPMSGEHFASGIMDNGEVWGERVWYKNKKQAMNAAAAKALDCFAFRESGSGGSSSQRCDDKPYFEDETPNLSLPPNVVLPSELIQPDNT